jgi:glycerophosphoryl diester phosphodiesterase
MPSSPSRKAELARLGAKPFAHRGLHGPGVVENSLAAFEAAIEAGHGIELDVQVSADGEAIVFHDYQLERLTEARGPVARLGAAELALLPYRGGGGNVPTLAVALRHVAGRAALLVEVKAPGRRVDRLCRAVARALAGYRGSVGVMSFNPEVGRWFSLRAPDVIRGLVVSEDGRRGFRGRLERRLSLLRARPDFLACDIRDLPSLFAAAARARGLPVYTWTVRTDSDWARAAAQADQIIYEAAA